MAYDSVQTGPGLDCDGRLGQLYQTQEFQTSDRLVVKLCLILNFAFIYFVWPAIGDMTFISASLVSRSDSIHIMSDQE